MNFYVLFQEKTAELQKTRIKSKIATEIVPEAQWFTAEEYHQVHHADPCSLMLLRVMLLVL